MPWLGYFNKIIRADEFIFLDNVQYKKNEWQNRNRIKTSTGPQWITAPTTYKFPQKINEVRINNAENWRHKHLQALVTNYSKAPYFKKYMPYFEEYYARDWDLLVDLNIASVNLLLQLFKVDKKCVRASEMDLRDSPNERLIDICKIYGADTYLAGVDGAKYMDLELFEREGIHVVFQNFHHPHYLQLFGDFDSHLSAIDLLFNCGEEGRAFFMVS